jgi:hypothetical protein
MATVMGSPSGITWTQYYGIVSPLNTPIAPGNAVPFPNAGNSIGAEGQAFPTQVSPTVVALPTGTWRIVWQVGIQTPGQLGLQYYTTDPMSPILIPESVTGTSWGHCQIAGDTLVEVPSSTTYNMSLVNPGSNTANVVLLVAGIGGISVSNTITYECLW